MFVVGILNLFGACRSMKQSWRVRIKDRTIKTTSTTNRISDEKQILTSIGVRYYK